ncbi:MAG: hypothetical protein ACPGU0_09115, partial [Marinirhabdus sp.]
LNFACQTNGREIGCQGIAIKHNFGKPKTNIFKQTAKHLFGNGFYANPAKFPSNKTMGKNALLIIPPKPKGTCPQPQYGRGAPL